MTAIATRTKPGPSVSPWAAASRFLPLVYRAFPGASSRFLVSRFFTPWKRLPPLEVDVPRRRVEFDGQAAYYSVAGDGPLVILVHGWSGASSQFKALWAELLEAGFRVAAFDAPGHGASPGRSSNAGQFRRVIQQISEEHGSPLVIIGHSLGALAACMSAESVNPVGLVLIAPMPSLDFALDQFQESLGFDDRLRERVTALIERRAHVSRSAARVESCLAQRPALLVHDTLDRRVPVDVSHDLCARFANVEYFETNGLGHNKVLADPRVIERILTFMRSLRGKGVLTPSSP